MYICEKSLDDLLMKLFSDFLRKSTTEIITGRKGKYVEKIGALLELENPRSRLSRSEVKGTPFSCLGELTWYLSKSNELSHIKYYLGKYDEYSDDGTTVYGGYGPRIFNMHGSHNQFENIISHLEKHKSSRRAVIQIFDAEDLIVDGKDIPCTTSLQFFVRKECLDVMVSMRSNDIYKGLPHDIFCFTMIQEIMAARLKLKLGSYKHCVGSLHLYEKNFENAKQYVNEGWQSTLAPMPEMPDESIVKDLKDFLTMEKTIRESKPESIDLKSINNYWDDIIKLLMAFKLSKNPDTTDKINRLKNDMHSKIYDAYFRKLDDKTKK